MDTLRDEQLMARMMAGDANALALLVERHYSALLGYLYRLLRSNRPLAEDLAQETFLRIMQQGNYQLGRAFKPWLYTIATNLVRDYFKSASVRRCAASADEVMQAIYDTAPGPEEAALTAEQGSMISAAIGRLGEEYRTVLLLRFYNSLSLQEIADTLNIPLGTVKSRLSVGTHRLRALLIAVREEGVRQ